MTPLKIKVVEKRILYILWNDNLQTTIELTKLRKICPCALCEKDRENKDKKIIPIMNTDEITVSDIQLVGNYALNIKWKDGHNSGYYNYNFIRDNSSEYHNCKNYKYDFDING